MKKFKTDKGLYVTASSKEDAQRLAQELDMGNLEQELNPYDSTKKRAFRSEIRNGIFVAMNKGFAEIEGSFYEVCSQAYDTLSSNHFKIFFKDDQGKLLRLNGSEMRQIKQWFSE